MRFKQGVCVCVLHLQKNKQTFLVLILILILVLGRVTVDLEPIQGTHETPHLSSGSNRGPWSCDTATLHTAPPCWMQLKIKKSLSDQLKENEHVKYKTNQRDLYRNRAHTVVHLL